MPAKRKFYVRRDSVPFKKGMRVPGNPQEDETPKEQQNPNETNETNDTPKTSDATPMVPPNPQARAAAKKVIATPTDQTGETASTDTNDDENSGTNENNEPPEQNDDENTDDNSNSDADTNNTGDNTDKPDENDELKQEIDVKWKQVEQHDKRVARALGGLRLSGELADTAMKAFSSLSRLAGSLMTNPFTSPTNMARNMLQTTITDSFNAMQGVVDNIGHVWGIKDGIKDPKDIAGTYKGAQYYKDHAETEAVQAMFAKDLGEMTKEIFGDDADPTHFGDLLMKAVDDGDIEKIKAVSKKLQATYDSEEGKRLRAEVNKEEMDRNNDAIPKEEKYQASAKAKMFDTIYRKYLRGTKNASEWLAAAENRKKVQARENKTNLSTNAGLQRKAEKLKAEAAKITDENQRREYLLGQGELGISVMLAEQVAKKRDVLDVTRLAADGLPMMGTRMEDNLIANLSNRKEMSESDPNFNDKLIPEEEEILKKLLARRKARQDAKKPAEPSEPTMAERVQGMIKNPDAYGASASKKENEAIYGMAGNRMIELKDTIARKTRAALIDKDIDAYQNMTEDEIEREIEKALREDPEYIELHGMRMAAYASNIFNEGMNLLNKMEIVDEDEDGFRASLLEARKKVAQFWKGYGQNKVFVPNTEGTEAYDALAELEDVCNDISTVMSDD